MKQKSQQPSSAHIKIAAKSLASECPIFNVNEII